jgi:hypothetical protein
MVSVPQFETWNLALLHDYKTAEKIRMFQARHMLLLYTPNSWEYQMASDRFFDHLQP